jgi:hypothetical protein
MIALSTQVLCLIHMFYNILLDHGWPSPLTGLPLKEEYLALLNMAAGLNTVLPPPSLPSVSQSQSINHCLRQCLRLFFHCLLPFLLSFLGYLL